jgi:hypothetical protein
MLRREIKGNTVATTLSATITSSTTPIGVADATTFPVGSIAIPFVITIDRGTASEEKILISGKTGGVSGSLTPLTRGYDGTTAVGHNAGALVDHVLDATTLQDMNTTVYDTKILTWMGL